MNEAIVLSNVHQHKLINIYHYHTKENSFLQPIFFLQLHINSENTGKAYPPPLLQHKRQGI